MMTHMLRFGLGGLGGLLPVLATLVAIDLSAIASLIDKGGLTEGLCVGYAVRVLGLFALGGIMAALNNQVTSPLALVQIGIAAPALVTSYVAGTQISTPKNEHAFQAITTTAYADELMEKGAEIMHAGFFDEVVQGIKPGLGLDAIQTLIKKNPPPPTPPALNVPYRVITSTTKVCLNVPAEQVQTPDAYTSLVRSFPSPNFTTEPGICP